MDALRRTRDEQRQVHVHKHGAQLNVADGGQRWLEEGADPARELGRRKRRLHKGHREEWVATGGG